ncbi:MAG TPA: NAD-dependent deacylase [Candidatus Eisenbacteria bacterium]|nr:NAD-dependent deacylase [Candidatus Eisenbacteria bacterium]
MRRPDRDRLFVLTGAGISAESGIRTFRGVDGLWRGHRIEEVATPGAFAADPLLVWTFYSERRRAAAGKEPNPAHRALARLESALGDRFFLCTQNVDDLHEAAGSRRVRHMHGRLFQSRCSSPACATPPFDDRWTLEGTAELRRCPACGALLRPHVCWFGEVPYEMDAIEDALERCDLLLVVGTSGVVHPAASFVALARGRGARAIYVGPEAPANAAAFDDLTLAPAGRALPELVDAWLGGPADRGAAPC